jgi:hypothetical protein
MKPRLGKQPREERKEKTKRYYWRMMNRSNQEYKTFGKVTCCQEEKVVTASADHICNLCDLGNPLTARKPKSHRLKPIMAAACHDRFALT